MRPRAVRIEGDVAYVTLTKGYEAVVDAADAEWVGQWNWFARPECNHVYAVRTVVTPTGRKHVYMHRAMLSPADGVLVDHRDGNGLNNRRGNLRPCTMAENLRNVGPKRTNTSGHKGVSFDERRRKWKAEIRAGDVKGFLGRFDHIADAVAAREAAALEMHGQFARGRWGVELAA